MALILTLELLSRCYFIREVMGWYDGNDTMLRWSDQLVLVAENELFNDGVDLEEEGGGCGP